MTFVDVQDVVINALNDESTYDVHILDAAHDSVSKTEEISDFSGLKTGDPATLEAIASADVITTSVGPEVLKKVAPTIADGIKRHRKQGRGGGLTIIACENMVGATSHLQEYVMEALKDSKDDVEYAKEHVGFANCEVDRIVPPFKGDGHHPLEVGVEGFFEWVVEKGNVKGDLQVKGMQLKDNLEPFLERKLYTLNCGHAMLAFLGHVKGYKTINDSVQDEELVNITRSSLEQSGAALVKKHGFDEKEHKQYIEVTMMRFANPNIHDDLVRVSRKPLRKLSPKERLVGAIGMCIEYDLPRDYLIKGVAAAFYFDFKDDDEAVELMRLVKEKGIEQAIVETTEFDRDSAEHKQVLREYQELKKWKEFKESKEVSA